MRINQRVTTLHGVGTIIKKEFFGSGNDYRVGVKHDVFPADMPRMYTDDILYYFRYQVQVINKNSRKQ